MRDAARTGISTDGTSATTFSATQQLADPRADGGVRLVHLSPEKIVIERRIKNVRMTVAVPVATYRGLVVSVRLATARATLILRHADPDLDVILDSGEAIEIAKKAKGYAAVFQKAISLEEAGVLVMKPFHRTLKVPAERRPGFLTRRKAGDARRLQRRFKDEAEIIARD